MNFSEAKEVTFWRKILDEEGPEVCMEKFYEYPEHWRVPVAVAAEKAFEEYAEIQGLTASFRQEEREINVLKTAQKANDIAREANGISRSSNNLATAAICLSIIAIVVSVFVAVVQK